MAIGWSHLQQSVKRLNSDQQAVQRSVVAQCRFTEDSSHVLFLGVTASSREHTLHSVRLRPGIDASHSDWCRLVLDSQPDHALASLSREELLLRERQRVGINGITSYELDSKAARVLFHAAGGIHICDVCLLPYMARTRTSPPFRCNMMVVLWLALWYYVDFYKRGK